MNQIFPSFLLKFIELFVDKCFGKLNRRVIMKVNKIISIAVINGLTLLVFASLLASCQKNSIHTKGHFTEITLKAPSRSIASSEEKNLDSLRKHFDLKQIYIYCSLNDTRVEKCYKENIKKIIHQYEQKVGKFSEEQIKQLSSEEYFNSLELETKSVVFTIMKKIDTHIGQLVNKRENFCKVNSKFYIKRCLKQYLDADTMAVLNKYQQHHTKMNGHEYLYLKNGIERQFLSKLEVSYKKLKQEEKKS